MSVPITKLRLYRPPSAKNSVNATTAKSMLQSVTQINNGRAGFDGQSQVEMAIKTAR